MHERITFSCERRKRLGDRWVFQQVKNTAREMGGRCWRGGPTCCGTAPLGRGPLDGPSLFSPMILSRERSLPDIIRGPVEQSDIPLLPKQFQLGNPLLIHRE